MGADNFEPEMNSDFKTRNVRSRILQQAEICICGEREQDYGSPETNFAIIAEMWTAYTGTSCKREDKQYEDDKMGVGHHLRQPARS